MKTFILAPVLAMLALASPYAAADDIHVPGFTLSETWTMANPQLLSNEGGTARIAIPGLSGGVAGAWGPNSDSYPAALIGTVQPGYRIDSLTVSGTMYGTAEVRHEPVCDGCTLEYFGEGVAWNVADVGWTLRHGEGAWFSPVTQQQDLQADRPFSFTYGTAFDGTFGLDLHVSLGAYAVGDYMLVTDSEGNLQEYYTYAYALAGMKDVVLTVQVSAVPEPATYAMLLGGLGAIAWVARRRKT
jgi:hypothetical protein